MGYDSKFDNNPQGSDSIFPSDFFAFGIGSAVIGNAYFEYPHSQLGDFSCNFWFEAEAVFFDPDRLNNFPPESLVAGFHVGDVQICEHIREQSQDSISYAMPKVENPVSPTAHESGTENNVCAIF